MTGNSKPLSNIVTSVLYRNPEPHVFSRHAYFPSVVALSDSELLAVYTVGEAFESPNLHTCLARSHDGGISWSQEGRVPSGQSDGRLTSDTARLAAPSQNELVVNLIRHDRSAHPDEGLTNPENLGFVPTDLLLTRSTDRGKTWTAPVTISPPLEGPAFEMCAPITPLRDGRWLWPTSTWRGWDGALPNGNRMVAFVSKDKGKTWPAYLDVMHSADNRIIFWESKIIELPDGRLLAVAWRHDAPAGQDLPNGYTISSDGGQTWAKPMSTGLQGQTLTPLLLPDGRLLCLYRRIDEPGLWAQVVTLEGDRWINLAAQPLWGHHSADGGAGRQSMVDQFRTMRFGAPCVISLPDRTCFAAFWCHEQCQGIIRCFRFSVQ